MDANAVIKEMAYLTRGARSAVDGRDVKRAQRYLERIDALVTTVMYEYKDIGVPWKQYTRDMSYDMQLAGDTTTMSRILAEFSEFWRIKVLPKLP